MGAENSEEYLRSDIFTQLGIHFIFPRDPLPKKNLMIMDGPVFLFGSDLTRKFQGAMVSDAVTKLVPENQKAPFYFCPEEYGVIYERNAEYIRNMAISKTLGRGMFCIELNKAENIFEAANFVRTYQKNTGLLIGSLEEIAFRKGIIGAEQLIEIAEKTEYVNKLKELL